MSDSAFEKIDLASRQKFRLPYDGFVREEPIGGHQPLTSRCIWCPDSFTGTPDEAREWSRKHRLEHRKAGVERA